MKLAGVNVFPNEDSAKFVSLQNKVRKGTLKKKRKQLLDFKVLHNLHPLFCDHNAKIKLACTDNVRYYIMYFQSSKLKEISCMHKLTA